MKCMPLEREPSQSGREPIPSEQANSLERVAAA